MSRIISLYEENETTSIKVSKKWAEWLYERRRLLEIFKKKHGKKYADLLEDFSSDRMNIAVYYFKECERKFPTKELRDLLFNEPKNEFDRKRKQKLVEIHESLMDECDFKMLTLNTEYYENVGEEIWQDSKAYFKLEFPE